MDGSTIFCLVVIIIIVGALVVMANARAARARALAAASAAYQEALGKLRNAPTNPSLREAALGAGRAFAALARESKGSTVFDEVALKNDLDAATAGAATVAAVAVPAPAASAADRLRQLDKLKTDGLITEAEYAARREKILSEM
jgi:hypothetical protein